MNAEIAARNDKTNAPVAGGVASQPRQKSLAIVTTVIDHDQITTTVQLLMGSYHHTVQRTWQRAGNHSFRSTQRDFIHREDQLGIELAEYADSLGLPVRVANMLPHAPSKMPEGVAAAVRGLLKEVRHG